MLFAYEKGIKRKTYFFVGGEEERRKKKQKKGKGMEKEVLDIMVKKHIHSVKFLLLKTHIQQQKKTF